jgi:putative NADPH-quinone reductase
VKILIVDGHPSRESFVGALADAYAAGARDQGHEVEVLRLSEMDLEPYLKYRHGTDHPVMTPDLEAMRTQLVWADHYVFAYPIWWGLPPALLKVYFEVVFAPGVAFRYLPRQGSRVRWERLLAGRTAQLLVTGDAPPWFWRYVRGAADERALERSILGFCGVRTMKTAYFGSVKTSTPAERQQWLSRARALGSRGPSRRSWFLAMRSTSAGKS